MSTQLLDRGGEACRRAEQAFLTCIAACDMEPLLRRGVLVAFSGGMDSVLLLDLMQAYTKAHGIPLAAAHVHHGIRGATADRDAAFCARIAQERGIPFFLAREDALAFARGEGQGIGQEAAAREVRYRALSRLMDEHPAYGVTVTAHHATDNLETVLLNLMRGSGLRGMCGIPPVRDRFLRPLLYVPQRDIAAAVAELALPYVTDETNESEAYDRNYIRAHIVPHLTHLRNDPEGAVTRLCLNLREEENCLDALAEDAWQMHVRDCRISREALLALPRALAYRIVVRLFAACGAAVHPERTHVCSLLAVLAGDTACGQYPMPGGYVASFTKQELTFCKQNVPICPAYDIPLQIGENILGESGGSLWLFTERQSDFEIAARNVYNLFIQAKLDSVTIGNVLRARTRREGDAYRYGGMTRRVRRLLSGRHLPKEQRAGWPIVYDEQGIVWVPGFGVRDTVGEEQGASLYVYYTYGKREKSE